MTSLAERLAPHLATLVHPGDDNTPPFPLAMAQFQTAALPEGMQQEMADEMGLPTPDLSLHFMEAIVHLIKVQTGIDLDDPELTPEKLADQRAAASANEGKRIQKKTLQCRNCRTSLANSMTENFDTEFLLVNGPELIKAMGNMSAECTTKHRSAP